MYVLPLIVVVTLFGEELELVVICIAPLMYQSGRPACSVISSVELSPSVISDNALKRLSAMGRLGVLRVGRIGRRVGEPPGLDAVGTEVVARNPGPGGILVDIADRHAAVRLRGWTAIDGNRLVNGRLVRRIVEVAIVVIETLNILQFQVGKDDRSPAAISLVGRPSASRWARNAAEEVPCNAFSKLSIARPIW